MDCCVEHQGWGLVYQNLPVGDDGEVLEELTDSCQTAPSDANRGTATRGLVYQKHEGKVKETKQYWTDGH